MPVTRIPAESRVDAHTFAFWAAATNPEPVGVVLDTALAPTDSHAKVSNHLLLIKHP